jgi:hypothetical protein
VTTSEYLLLIVLFLSFSFRLDYSAVAVVFDVAINA